MHQGEVTLCCGMHLVRGVHICGAEGLVELLQVAGAGRLQQLAACLRPHGSHLLHRASASADAAENQCRASGPHLGCHWVPEPILQSLIGTGSFRDHQMINSCLSLQSCLSFVTTTIQCPTQTSRTSFVKKASCQVFFARTARAQSLSLGHIKSRENFDIPVVTRHYPDSNWG